MRFILYFILLRWFFRITFSAQTDPIETLFVNIEGNFSGLLDDADEGVDKTKDKLDELDGAAEKSGGSMKKGAALAGAAFGLAGGVAGKLLDVVINIATAAVQMFKNMTSQAIQLAGDFEQVQLTFTNIFKDRGQANAFLKGLQGEATKLGISFNEASQFAKSLFPDTKNIEEFNNLLRVAAVGAADAGLPLQELIFSFNEAVTGDFTSIRDRLDIPRDVIERIKESPDTVSALTEELDKLFTKRGVNDLEAAGSTLQGLQRQIKGFGEELLLVAGLEILGPLREGFQDFKDVLDANKPALTEIATGLGEIVGIVVNFVKEDIFGGFSVEEPIEQIKAFVEQLKVVVRAGLAFVSQLKEYGKALLSLRETAIAPFVKAFDSLRERLGLGEISFQRLDKALIAGAQVMAIVSASVKALVAAFAPLVDVIGNAGKALFAFITGDFKGAAEAAGDAIQGIKDGVIDTDAGYQAFRESILQSAKDIDRIANPIEKIKEDVESIPPIKLEVETEEIAIDEAVLGKIDSLTDQMIDATKNRNEQLAELEESHAEKIDEIVADTTDKRLKIQKDADEDLLKNDQETEEKRLKVIEDARTELSKLGNETDRELKSRRDEFQKDELRETEDHLKAMRELTDNFLSSLQDAVKNRDARAVVDLQAKFQQEKSERDEDFFTKQDRGREDQDEELATIRETEAQKRDEILASQAEELAQLQSHNEQKRAEIIAERDQELADLDESTRVRLNKENEAFAERQAQLDQALAKQLESIAENLAKQKDVTAEGAQTILETLNETFGAGGDIDSLMENFAKRRSVRANIKIDFETRSGVKPKGGEEKPLTPIERIRAGLSAPGASRLGGVQAFGEGGTLLARKPTLALFGEAGPEVVQFTPMADLSSPGGGEPGRMIIEMTGSAPPGIGAGDRDQIAGVLLTALRDTGALAQ